MPRNFKLLDELEKADHGQTHPSLSLGLENLEDMTLTNWQASIIGPGGGNFDGRFYSIRVTCTESYPAQPPIVQFISKINIPGVNQSNGQVSGIDVLNNWNPNQTIESVLVNLFQLMEQNRQLPQPSEDSTF